MIRVLVVTPYAQDANSYHRCVGPWSYLANQSRKTKEEISFTVAQDGIGMRGVGWDTVGQFDLVFMHRPCRPDDLTILKVARNMNVPVWIDYDDWLFDVPGWNPNASAYHNPGLQHIMATCLASADLVSVTTSALYDVFRKVNKNTVIVPNCYRSDLYPYRQKNQPRKTAFAWRGTNTHDADIMSVQDGMKNLPGPITFYGAPPWSLTSQLKPNTFSVVGPQDPFMYMKQIYHDAPACMVVPLVDCLFNRVKSNIAYQEALHAGALTIAPDLPEWQRPGVVTYKPGDSGSFLEAANEVAGMNAQSIADHVESAHTHMLELYDTRVTNLIREQIVTTLCGSEHERNTRDPFDQLTGVWALAQLKNKPLDHAAQHALQKKQA